MNTSSTFLFVRLAVWKIVGIKNIFCVRKKHFFCYFAWNMKHCAVVVLNGNDWLLISANWHSAFRCFACPRAMFDLWVCIFFWTIEPSPKTKEIQYNKEISKLGSMRTANTRHSQSIRLKFNTLTKQKSFENIEMRESKTEGEERKRKNWRWKKKTFQ